MKTLSFDAHSLKKVPILKGLHDSDYTRIFSLGKIKHFQKNISLFNQGDEAAAVLIILEGKIKISQIGEDGNQVLLRVLGPGQLLAGVAVLENGTYPATGNTLEKTTLFCLDKTALLLLMSQYPPIALSIIQLLLKRIEELQKRFREIATERVEIRIARTLLHFASQHGIKKPEGILIDFPLTRQDLAEFTGTTLFSVSRLLKTWEREEILESGRKKVTLLQVEKLKSILKED
ncbi:MAG: Crp/Fnr family transcriptional regulator [Deltaproteobacteria bacterium]|nr:Crp/Fnr family transcriptional regulator [Deltaproteobacteria bacterium]